MTSVTASVAVMLTDLVRNLLRNCLGDLYRNLGTVFLGNWVTLFFRNLHWNLDGNFAAGLVGNLFTFLVRDLYWDGVAGLLGDVVTDRDRDLLAVLLRNLVTFFVISVSVALVSVGGGALLLVGLA